MVPPQHFLNPLIIGFRKLPSWWAHWGAGRMVHPERAWKCHTLLSPEYFILNISSTWLFLSCGHFNKPVTVSKWTVFLISMSCSSWDFWDSFCAWALSPQPSAWGADPCKFYIFLVSDTLLFNSSFLQQHQTLSLLNLVLHFPSMSVLGNLGRKLDSSDPSLLLRLKLAQAVFQSLRTNASCPGMYSVF